MFIDTHAHLNSRAFSRDVDEVIAACFDAGVERIINIGIDVATSRVALDLAQRYPGKLFATVGVHPSHANEVDDNYLDDIKAMSQEAGCVGIGEIGLDYYHDTSFVAKQKDVFREQLDLACELKQPIVIHCRESLDDIKAVLLEYDAFEASGIMHCYSGDSEYAAWLYDRCNLLVSFNGIMTYPKAPDVREVAKTVPLDRLVLETDCPYLSPHPKGGGKRARRNDPSAIPAIAECLADVKGVSVAEVMETTTACAEQLFCLS